MTDWQHKDEWERMGNNYCVVVSRHSARAFYGQGEHRWCIYAYIYPKHRLFSKFSGNDMWQEAACSMPLHGGPSFLKWHYDDAMKPVSIQVGCDYNHLHDDYFTHYATKEEAYEVFSDADRLCDYLNDTLTELSAINQELSKELGE